MPCLIISIAVYFPRVVLIIIALLTHWIGRSFDTMLWPILGFLFLPYTTLAYMAAMLNNNHTVSGGWLALVIIAAVVDLGGQGRSARRRKRIL